MLALHHMDALWYQLLSIPRAISHLELKHDMPCQDSLWATTTAAEWAHRKLVASHVSPAVRYNEAIRFAVNPELGGGPAPQFELQGMLNVIHFVQSSLREVSGWSAMTGLVSQDRFDVSGRYEYSHRSSCHLLGIDQLPHRYGISISGYGPSGPECTTLGGGSDLGNGNGRDAVLVCVSHGRRSRGQHRCSPGDGVSDCSYPSDK
jgi:hypothetical protein